MSRGPEWFACSSVSNSKARSKPPAPIGIPTSMFTTPLIRRLESTRNGNSRALATEPVRGRFVEPRLEPIGNGVVLQSFGWFASRGPADGLWAGSCPVRQPAVSSRYLEETHVSLLRSEMAGRTGPGILSAQLERSGPQSIRPAVTASGEELMHAVPDEEGGAPKRRGQRTVRTAERRRGLQLCPSSDVK